MHLNFLINKHIDHLRISDSFYTIYCKSMFLAKHKKLASINRITSFAKNAIIPEIESFSLRRCYNKDA